MEIKQKDLWDITETILDKNISIRIALSGNSMMPFLRQGDEAIVTRAAIYDLNTGDIVIFKKQEQYIAHRLLTKTIGINGYILTTKGDACKEADNPISENEIIGKVIQVTRNSNSVKLTGFWRTFTRKLFVTFPEFSYYNYLLYYYTKKLFYRS